MARRSKQIIVTKKKDNLKPMTVQKQAKLTMTPLEIRNARKSFLLKEELSYEEKKHNAWEELLKLERETEFPTEEKKLKEKELFKIVINADEKLIEINEQLIKIEKLEEDERHQEALKNTIKIDDDSVEIIEVINIDIDED